MQKCGAYGAYPIQRKRIAKLYLNTDVIAHSFQVYFQLLIIHAKLRLSFSLRKNIILFHDLFYTIGNNCILHMVKVTMTNSYQSHSA